MAASDVNLLQSGESRVFIQTNPTPAGAVLYYGTVSVDGSEQDLGEPEPIYSPSRTRRNTWDVVGKLKKAQGLPTFEIKARMEKFLTDIWWELKERSCEFTLYVVNGTCQRPDDFTQFDSVIMYPGSQLTNFSTPTFNPMTADDNAVLELTGSVTALAISPLRTMTFGEVADTAVLAEILDGFFYDLVTCGECGTPSDGCTKNYWLQRANTGSPGLSGQLVYTTDGDTYSSQDITTLGGLAGDRIAPVGNYCVVVSQATGAHHYASFEDIDAGTNAWTKVATGYVSGKGPRAIYSSNPALTFVAGAGGYVYKMTSPTLAVATLSDGTLTAQDLNDIHGAGRVVVAVGNSNALIYSTNAGDTWTTRTGPLVGQNLSAVYCVSESTWVVGTGNGKMYYTLNQGRTWAQAGIPATVTIINDIQFASPQVGFMVAETTAGPKLFRSIDSGNTWSASAPAVQGVPTANRYNVAAPCGNNKCAIGGRKSVGGDGVIAVGA